MIKAVAIFLLSALLIIVCFVALYTWDSSKNRGRTTGYWAEFNRTSNAVASVPGVSIVSAWSNDELFVLEEFVFQIETNGQKVTLHFGEKDPIRTMDHEKAVAALKSNIQTQLSNTNQ